MLVRLAGGFHFGQQNLLQILRIVNLAVLSPRPQPCKWGLPNWQKAVGWLLGFEACLNLLQKGTNPLPDV
ncbi:MAG: hypothetical protein VKN56_00525 [Cyanobacteriota bacterium]|nr:hypothetical protein [Cyanobacteriota bacterium]